MDKNPTKPSNKPLPYFPAHVPINSKYYYSQFLKTKPKYIHKLQFEQYSAPADNFKTRRAIAIHIKKLTQSSKHIRCLNISEFSDDGVPYSTSKDIVKRFHRIKKLSHLWVQNEVKSTFLNYLYLKYLKSLQSLFLNCEVQARYGPKSKKLPAIIEKFMRLLHQSKLKQLNFHLQDREFPSHQVINFPEYPSSLESWALVGKSFQEKFKQMDYIYRYLNLSRLEKLKSFQMRTFLALDLINQALKSIPNLSQLKTLAFRILNEGHPTEIFLPQTLVLLEKCKEIENFYLASDPWIDLFDSLSDCKLKTLELDIHISEKENLKQLGNFIRRQEKSLESLSLEFLFKEDPKAFVKELCNFLEKLSNLKSLKSLKLDFKTFSLDKRIGFAISMREIQGEIKKEVDFLPILPAIITLVKELKDLQELDISHAGADFTNGLEEFFQALQEKSCSLEKLELGLGDYNLKKKDVEILTRGILECKSLEYLHLRRFMILDSSFFEGFREMVYQHPKLKYLIIGDIDVDVSGYNPQDFLAMIENILKKPSLRKFFYRQEWNKELDVAYSLCEKLRFSKTYACNPALQDVRLPFFIAHWEFLSKWH